MAEKPEVHFLKIREGEDDHALSQRLQGVIREKKLLSFVQSEDMVAIKTHFGEAGSDGYVRPVFLKMMADEVKNQKGNPFLTETATLYKGERSHAVNHLHMAHRHGFSMENTGCPIIMADGLLGDEEIQVDIPGILYKKVGIAALIVRAQALVAVSHFTGHMLTGFGATLKNLGMGCASRRGKLIQHSTAKPSIKISQCTGCGVCVQWCPQSCITLQDNKAVIDRKRCIGCAECLAVCRFDAVGYNWSETYERLQEKMAEYAMGVATCKKDHGIYFNFLTRMTRDCDCMKGHNRIFPDMGVLFSTDPVAVDAAAVDVIEKQMGKPLSKLTFDVPYRVQLEHAEKLGMGRTKYTLIEL